MIIASSTCLNPDAGMVNGANDVLGYDSIRCRCDWTELIAVTQGRGESALNVASHLVYPIGLYHPFYKAFAVSVPLATC